MRADVIDLSHHNEVTDFAKVKAAGVKGVIHKATQGNSYKDRMYATRRATAEGFGLLWGAYHFGTAHPVKEQVEHFLSVVGSTTETLLALDWEPDPKGPTMTVAQAKLFLQQVADRTGQRPVLYSGHLLKETVKKPDEFLVKHRLWLAQYGKVAKLPVGFKRYFLWQFTGDGIGPEPHSIPGIKTFGIDINQYEGEDLASEWVERVK